jgi:hypothetical protein
VREERRLKAVENRMLRSIFGSKSDKIRGEWRRLHKEELNDLYSSPNIIWVLESRKIRRGGGGACRPYGVEGRCIQDFGGETWRKETIERPT